MGASNVSSAISAPSAGCYSPLGGKLTDVGWLWVIALLALFVLPAVLVARLQAPPRERDSNNASDAANVAEQLRRHQFR